MIEGMDFNLQGLVILGAIFLGTIFCACFRISDGMSLCVAMYLAKFGLAFNLSK